jgi:hypothetical protein
LRSTADLAQNDGPEISQRAGQRRFVHARRRWPAANAWPSEYVWSAGEEVR